MLAHDRCARLPMSLASWRCCSLAAALPFFVSDYRIFQFTMVVVYAIALLGLNILTGYNGQISLGPWRVLRDRRLHRRRS